MCSLCFILPVFWDINVLNVFLRLCFGVGETFLGWFWSGAVVVTPHFAFLFATKFLSGKVFACFSLNQGPDNIKVLLWLQKHRQILEIILEKKPDKPAFVNKKCDGDTFKERLCWNMFSNAQVMDSICNIQMYLFAAVFLLLVCFVNKCMHD